MKEPASKKTHESGMEEAIHPEIGNGSEWETNPQISIIKSVDPAKMLDPFLLNEESHQAVLNQWKEDLEAGFWPDAKEPLSRIEAEKASTPEEIPALPGETEEPVTHIEPPVLKIKPEKVKKEKKEIEAGKLVKKASKAIEKQQKESGRKAVPPASGQGTTELSPFTKWLKALKGSEYVHPYDDDFAFLQSSGPGREGISETFADLLASQGYREQAVEMYRKLMEKYPEKSRFFAAKIEALL